MKQKKLLLLLFVFCVSLLSAQEIEFSHENSWYPQEFLLSLSGADTIWYTTDGSIPVPGSTNTFFYENSILVESLANTASLLYGRLADFVDSTSFYSQFEQGYLWHEDISNPPANSEIPKKTIIRACTGDCDEVVTRSFGIGDHDIQGWEVELIFDQPDLVWDKDSGMYCAGVGKTVPWLFGDFPGQPDSIRMANYDVLTRPELALPNANNPQGLPGLFDNVPDHWGGVNATVLFYKDNHFVEQNTAKTRPNGQGRLQRPLKAWKVKLDQGMNSPEAGFAVTDNFIARQRDAEGVYADVGLEIANQWKLGPQISRKGDHGVVHVYNGEFLECFGVFGLLSAIDKKHAKHFWGYDDPQKVESLGVYQWFFGPDTSRGGKRIEALNQIMDQGVTTLNYDSLTALVGNPIAWAKKWVQYSFLMPGSSWDKELKAYDDEEKGLMPLLKDGDSYLSFDHSGGLEINGLNPVAFFAEADTSDWPDAEMAEAMLAEGHTAALHAAVHNDSLGNFIKNLLFDGYEEAYRYGNTKPILDRKVESLRANWQINDALNRLNDKGGYWSDSMSHENNFVMQDSFLRTRGVGYLKNVIEYLMPSYTLADTFTINVNMENVFDTDCGTKEGVVTVNSMKFDRPGSRIHVKDFPVQVTANPSPGYVFDGWLEYPSEGQSFMLVNSTNNDVTLTPSFSWEVDMCEVQGSVRLSEVQPWNPQGSDKLELYNPTNETVSLCGVCITDRPEEPCKYQFACDSTSMIAPQSYFVIDFKDGDGGDYLISSFALNRDGESIGIYTNDSLLIEEFEWGIVDTASYGRCPGGNDFNRLDSLTWGKENYCKVTSVEEIQHEGLTVFPNPSRGSFTVKGLTTQTPYQVIDVAGRVVVSGSTSGDLNLNHLPEGYYTLQINDQNNQKNIKLVIVR